MPVWDVSRLPDRDQFDYWREVICQAFVPLTPGRTEPGPGFPFTVETHPLAEVNRALGTYAPGARLIAGGPERIARVGIITGGAGSMIAEARDAGLDTYITGEGAHHTYFDAVEWGLNVIYAGHYATETFGVRRLGELLAARFGVEHVWVDLPNPV